MAIRDFQTHTVYLKEHWNDQWTLMNQLFADRVTFCLSPEMPEAVLSYRYGEVKGYGENNFAARTPLSCINWYVLVIIDQGDDHAAKEWYGVIVDDSRERHGDYVGNVNESGHQAIVARGLEYLLYRKPVITSKVLDADLNVSEINAALAFNCGGGNDQDHIEVGNCSNGVGGFPYFASSLDQARKWSGRDVVKYVLKEHPPTVPAVMNWKLNAASNLKILDSQSPAFHCHGMTVADVINKVCDRRRLMGWYVDASSGNPEVVVVTFNDNLLALPDGTIVPANPNGFDWNFEDDALIKMAVVSSTSGSQYTHVICQGEKATGTFTLQNTDIDADWKSATETEYEAGASTAAGYAAMDDFQKMHAHQRIRKADKLMKVFRYFRINPDWNGLATGEKTCPIGANDAQASFWWPGLRVLGRLPLETEKDYETVSSITDDTKPKTRPEYRRCFAIAEEYVSGGGNTYSYLDRGARGHDIGDVAETQSRQWSATMRPQETTPGFILDVHGAPQHVIAKDTFTACDAVDEADYTPELDWRNFYFTICVEFHEYAEGRWPANPPNGINGERDNILMIRAPHKRADYLAPDTVIDIDKEGAIVQTNGGWIQDDRTALKSIAKSAYEWYSTPRAAVEIMQHNLVADANGTAIHVGKLLSVISRPNTAVEVNGIVNKMVFDLRNGNLSLSTTYTEFDFVGGLK